MKRLPKTRLPKTRLPKTLLVTHFPPSQRNGSIHHVMAVIERYPEHLVWFSTKAPPRGQEPALPVPYGHGFMPDRPSRMPWKALRHHFTLGPWARKLGRDAAAFGKSHGVELVWTQLSLEAVVAGQVAAQRLGVPLAVTALDDPPSLLDYSSDYLSFTRRAFRRNFNRALATARSCGVISSSMARDYQERYGLEARVLYVGVDPEERIQPPSLEPAALDEPSTVRTLGSVGSVISEANWFVLLEALRLVNRQLGRPALRVLHLGELPERFAAPEVEATGWVEGEAMRRQLARIDLCFLSMWFEPERAYSARTAFPTKIRTFLASQRPILGLGPAESLALRFVEQEELGAVCHRPDAVELASTLRRMLEPEDYARAVRRVQAVAETFSREHYFESFETFLLDAVEPAQAA